MYSPFACRNLSSCHLPFNFLSRPARVVTILAVSFFLLANPSLSSAQTRARRANAEAEATRKRDADKKRTPTPEPNKQDNKKQIVNAPLVRKTALTYPKQPDNQAAKRPVLVNDITVVSRVGVDTPSAVRPAPAAAIRPAGAASANIPSIWPVVGPLRSGVGTRSNPFGGSSIEFHKGQDIAAPIGTPVLATADGRVIVAGWQRGYGWVVYIDHGNGITTRYGHLSRIDVEIGQTIRRGEQLGLVGTTGRSTGPHLHYEVRINGQPVSPLLYLPALPTSAAKN